MEQLAILGGKKVIEEPFPHQETIGAEEIGAVKDLLEEAAEGRANLSAYRGNYNINLKEPGFYGGPWIQALEEKFRNKFNTPSAIAVNSCTSALHIACGAIGLKPGDEVIVTPWSMSCSTTAPLLWEAIPVFADIDPNTYCLDPKSIESKITNKTKAIIVVDLFGLIADMKEIMEIAEAHNLYVIEDAAQAIGASYNGRFAGTLGHIGCFSFTQGKHLTAGEGGMIVANDPELAFKCQLLRNHSEAVINDMPEYKIPPNFIKKFGFNMRMTEIQAAIIYHQLDKLDRFIEIRTRNVFDIVEGIKDIPVLEAEYIPSSYPKNHVYYVHSLKFKYELGLSRDKFVNAVAAELTGEQGRPDKPMLGCGYIKPLYLFPIFHGDSRYYRGLCPVTEEMWGHKFFLSMYHGLPLEEYHINKIIEAFWKVNNNLTL